MNIVKQLEKQIEFGKTIILKNGTTARPEDVQQPLMKEYLAGVKSGIISPDISFKDYLENNATDPLTVQEVIDFIKEGDGEE